MLTPARNGLGKLKLDEPRLQYEKNIVPKKEKPNILTYLLLDINLGSGGGSYTIFFYYGDEFGLFINYFRI